MSLIIIHKQLTWHLIYLCYQPALINPLSPSTLFVGLLFHKIVRFASDDDRRFSILFPSLTRDRHSHSLAQYLHLTPLLRGGYLLEQTRTQLKAIHSFIYSLSTNITTWHPYLTLCIVLLFSEQQSNLRRPSNPPPQTRCSLSPCQSVRELSRICRQVNIPVIA